MLSQNNEVGPKNNAPKGETPRVKLWPDCDCTKILGDSHDKKPGVPTDGACNDLWHTCPYCGRNWWQFNRHFHLWKHVTDPAEWTAICSPRTLVEEIDY